MEQGVRGGGQAEGEEQTTLTALSPPLSLPLLIWTFGFVAWLGHPSHASVSSLHGTLLSSSPSHLHLQHASSSSLGMSSTPIPRLRRPCVSLPVHVFLFSSCCLVPCIMVFSFYLCPTWHFPHHCHLCLPWHEHCTLPGHILGWLACLLLPSLPGLDKTRTRTDRNVEDWAARVLPHTPFPCYSSFFIVV